MPRVTGRTLWWRCEQNTIASPALTKAGSSPASPMNSPVNNKSRFASMAWGTRPRAAIKIVARPREHHVKRVYATAIVVLLVPQSPSRCHRVVFYNPRHNVHSGRKITEMCYIRCACRGEHALQQLRKALIESSIGGKVRRGPE